MLIVLMAVVVILVLVFTLALCKAAGDADKRMEEEWEKNDWL
ncbi:MAG: hypothetical protein Q4F18_03500 [Clostridia bacterium]|nr:hypothetical protein [Clostridia bacterium]